jgi:hypothetical protein
MHNAFLRVGPVIYEVESVDDLTDGFSVISETYTRSRIDPRRIPAVEDNGSNAMYAKNDSGERENVANRTSSNASGSSCSR